MDKILYATDFSENAAKALKYACELSKKTGATLVALHVYDIPTIMSTSSNAPTFQDIERGIIEKNQKKLLDFCQMPEKENIRFETIRNKSKVRGIIEKIEELNPDLVVMGTKGETKLGELIMGSTSMGVIKMAKCPVLTIPEKSQDIDFNNIAYATDYNESDIVVINELVKFANIFSSAINIVHISHNNELEERDKTEWFKELLQEKVNYSKLKFDLVVSKDIYNGLNNFIQKNKITLIAMQEREHKNIIDKWFHGDLVRKMEFHSSLPLLCFNEKHFQKLAGNEMIQTFNKQK